MLGNFLYCNSTKLYFGGDALQNLSTELKKYGNYVALVYSGGSVVDYAKELSVSIHYKDDLWEKYYVRFEVDGVYAGAGCRGVQQCNSRYDVVGSFHTVLSIDYALWCEEVCTLCSQCMGYLGRRKM